MAQANKNRKHTKRESSLGPREVQQKRTFRIHPINNVSFSFSPRAMHNGDGEGFPERSGVVSCVHSMMPKLRSGGRADKISNKLPGDVACLGGSMLEHQPRLPGPRVLFPAGAFAMFSLLPKLHCQFPFLQFGFIDAHKPTSYSPENVSRTHLVAGHASYGEFEHLLPQNGSFEIGYF